ncbi:hypothetical protein SARC_00091 [Sphaeroforma arctica JP610]|uniref:Uncharacterized protein n=1 Tax=Sphaeroforma arctica JP610 TaxID=667725 RepID=A0A0L0GG41_9EUKA|nr:hypothetical protein SARC_00091 [Sphaeroforma arctica JP610]KNC87834.1 hypothetical protein SARC_00091 [Sphaeroforma arctica JP610]|eukprot:XP_014161736.1 hypothetical protein SARC_00091 [Sphaeroforma arctica JP610]
MKVVKAFKSLLGKATAPPPKYAATPPPKHVSLRGGPVRLVPAEHCSAYDIGLTCKTALEDADVDYLFDAANRELLVFVLETNAHVAETLIVQCLVRENEEVFSRLHHFPFASSDLLCTVLIVASTNNYTSTVRRILAGKKLKACPRNTEALVQAVEHNHAAIVRVLLLDDRVSNNGFQCLALIKACRHGHVGVLRLLLQDPCIRASLMSPEMATCGSTALAVAARMGQVGVLRVLLNNPLFNPEDFENLALQSAIASQDVRVVRLLLADPRVDPTQLITLPGATVDGQRSRRPRTMLSHACEVGTMQIVRLLLADPRVDSRAYGRTAMASARKPEIACLLLGYSTCE